MRVNILIFLNVDLPPPSKRRRGLAGSIVSTAVSAALIGTAVGLTVYRLCVNILSLLNRPIAESAPRWRDRGKDAEVEQQPPPQHPPPPYQQGEWTPVQQPQAIEITPPTPIVTPRRRKVRHGASSSAIKRHNARVRPRVHGQALSPPSSSLAPSRLPLSPEVVEDEEDVAVEDQVRSI
jgi:hypothetical protein